MTTHMLSCGLALWPGALVEECDCGAIDAPDPRIAEREALTRRRIAAMAFALRSHVTSPLCGPTTTALDIARGVAQVLACEPDADVRGALAESLTHRRKYLGLGFTRFSRGLGHAAEVGANAWREVA